MSEFKDFWDSFKAFEDAYVSHYRLEVERMLNEELDLNDWKIILCGEES